MRFRKAVLLVHGFAGGTYDEEFLANQLELNRILDVYAFTLPGHDSSVGVKITKEAWIEKAESVLEMLINNGYHHIYVIGHSMGGVIASHLASKYPQVKKLVLAAPAFKCFANKNGEFQILDVVKAGPDIIKTYTGAEVFSRFFKLPIKAVREFFALVSKYKDVPKKVKIPTLIIQGKEDQVVPVESARYVYKNLDTSSKTLLLCKRVTHDIFKGERKEEITERIEEFLISKVSSKPEVIEI